MTVTGPRFVAFVVIVAGLGLRPAARSSGLGHDAGQGAPPAQAATESLGTAAIVGRVVEDATGKPIEGVRVTRWLSTTPTSQYEVITDADGRFLFRGVRAGDYTVVAELASYRSGQYGRRRPEGPGLPLHVKDGEIVTGLTIRMFSPLGGLISGIVTDDAGEPVVAATVRVVQRRSSGVSDEGNLFGVLSYTTQTDDRGFYRLAVSAGELSVVIVPAPTSAMPASAPVRTTGARDVAGPATAGIDGPPIVLGDLRAYLGVNAQPSLLPRITGETAEGTAYRVITAPALSRSDNGTLIRIAAGTERSGVDIRLERAAAHRITGSVIGPDGPASHLNVRLIPWFANSPMPQGFDVATAVTQDDGTFTMVGVAAGDYVLRTASRGGRGPLGAIISTADTGAGSVTLTSGNAAPTTNASTFLWAELPITIGDADASHVEIRLARGVTVRGRIVTDPSPSLPPFPATARLTISLFGSAVLATATSAPVRPDGQFETLEFPPGRYTVSVGGAPNWLASSVTLGGQDVGAAGIEIGATNLDDLVVTLSNKSGSLTGSVRTPRGPDSDATVLAFPVGFGIFGGFGSPNQRFKQARVTPEGTYSMPGVLPGDYYVVAIDDAIAGDWRTPGMLEKLVPLATKVSVSDREPRALDLVTQVVR